MDSPIDFQFKIKTARIKSNTKLTAQFPIQRKMVAILIFCKRVFNIEMK